MRPLLAVDGDSFAHRAYHALPKSIRRAEGRPAGAIVGFANMLVRLWEAEQPRTVLVAWGIGWISGALTFLRRHAVWVSRTGGAFMVALGVLLVSGTWDHWMNLLRATLGTRGVGTYW